MKVSDLFWNASFDELKSGYIQDDDHYICLLCGQKIAKGIVYPEEGILYEAGKYMGIHINRVHQSVFEYLIQLDKKITGLTEHQTNLIQLFYLGKSDAEVQKEMGIGSASTIRNHRFALKEKERQSKVFLVMMELLKEKNKHEPTYLTPPKTAKMVDDRYNVTQQDSDKLLKAFFPEGTEGPLKTFSIKEKHKLVVLQEIAKRFQGAQTYTEKEINQILKLVYHDFATLRRYLIEYGFLDRTPDGSQYWLRNDSVNKEETTMDRKQELKRQYKETKIEAGVYQIRNTKNGKVLIESTPNLKTINGKLFGLEMGSHTNKLLQNEITEFGGEAFVIEVLEILEIPEDIYFDTKDALKKLMQKWLAKLQPYGERGYNTLKPIPLDA
ncbi:MAG: transcriptional regulator [Desulfosporosinus sp. BRH_c37]|nr:MAG: transcriptional regulator [Desulfosporosinus sp. BRH_c37]